MRAKFKVTEITRQIGSRQVLDGGYETPEGTPVTMKWIPAEMQSVKMVPVSGGSVDNKTFWDATPNGEIKLGIINQAAWSTFELDREYYVDFTPA